MENVRTNPVQDRVSAAVRLSPLTGREWADLLECSPQGVSDRLRGRTAWTLADTMTIAATLRVSVDALVGTDDLPIGFVLDRGTVDALATGGRAGLLERLARERHPAGKALEGER